MVFTKNNHGEIGKALLESVNDIDDCVVSAIVIGAHLMAVESRQVGLASLIDPTGGHLKQIPSANAWEKYIGKSASEVAQNILASDTFCAALGLASLTSLYDYRNMNFVNAKAQDILVEKGRGAEVAVIGHFPFVDRLRSEFRKLWVIELKPQEGDVDTKKGFEILPECDVVAITATTIINGTLEKILAACKPGSYKMLLGPSTPMTRVLFDFGIDILAGSKVTDREKVFAGIRQGKSFRYLEGIQTVCLRRS